MASSHDIPSQSLINAAIASLVDDNTVVGAGVLVGATAGLLGPLGLIGIGIAPLFYSSMLSSVSATGVNIPRQIYRGPLQIDMQWLAPEFNHDFTNRSDGETTYVRGNYPYERPCGSYRIALNVKDKFGNDNAWLGMTGNASGEWPVSYHGTAKHNAQTIAEEGYKLSRGERFAYGKGIYSTPEIKVAKGYASEFKHEGTSYKCILQNRVNPQYLKVIPKSENGIGTYWLSAAGKDGVDERELIRPYGICLFRQK